MRWQNNWERNKERERAYFPRYMFCFYSETKICLFSSLGGLHLVSSGCFLWLASLIVPTFMFSFLSDRPNFYSPLRIVSPKTTLVLTQQLASPSKRQHNLFPNGASKQRDAKTSYSPIALLNLRQPWFLLHNFPVPQSANKSFLQRGPRNKQTLGHLAVPMKSEPCM